MTEIALCTLNAKYIHASFGLRYLHANLGQLQSRARILEYQINDRILEIAESILSYNPKLIGLGIYIWNAQQSESLARMIKQIAPEVILVGGGPEISYETEQQAIFKELDYVIQGEGESAFRELCESILLRNERPQSKIILAPLPEIGSIVPPYDLYTDDDLANRIIYVEASRGCPFSCEFCLSSLDIPVRTFPLASLFESFQSLLDRGVKHFKFVDRTFNLNIKISSAILEFFLERYKPGLFLHFEMIPDRLPHQLRDLIAKFPATAIQLEVGIQSFNSEVNKLISRRHDLSKLDENFNFLIQHTKVHIHADLIVGLPGEDIESFGNGFNKLVKLAPQEIQIGILKRLRGTPITRHDETWGMLYDTQAPYEVLKTKLISFSEMQRLKRFARYWDIVANSGNFKEITKLLLNSSNSAFHSFLSFSDWLWSETGRRHGISLKSMAELLWRYLEAMLKIEPDRLYDAFSADFNLTKRPDILDFINSKNKTCSTKSYSDRTKRQTRHLS